VAFCSKVLTREEGQSSIDDRLMPKQEYSERIGWGRDAQGIDNYGLLNANDPRLSMTYAEFPLSSTDQLIDLGLTHVPKNGSDSSMTLVDIGSGCGRLVYYSALTRGSEEERWDVHGIEIASLLHDRAIEYLQLGMEEGLFCSSPSTPTNSISLNLGAAEEFSHLLCRADVVFAYSTTFDAKDFSPELGALILDPKWSDLLSKSCQNGCVAITTDRALDPSYGWQLVDRLDVENPEVFGSTGYVHILKKS
jgi:hypothetical protein